MQADNNQSEEIFSPRIKAIPPIDAAPRIPIKHQIKTDVKFFFILVVILELVKKITGKSALINACETSKINDSHPSSWLKKILIPFWKLSRKNCISLIKSRKRMQ